MNCAAVGLELSSVSMRIFFKDREEVARIVGGHPGMVDLTFLVLVHWVAAWRVSDLMDPQYAERVLDIMHQPMFALLVKLGLTREEADGFVQETYEEFYAAKDSSENPLLLLAGCFVSMCTSKTRSPGSYSLSLAAVQVVVQIGAIAHALNFGIPKIVERHAGK